MECNKWSIVYYGDYDGTRYGRVCNTIDEVSKFVAQLDGFTHIDILRFKVSDL